MLKSQYINVIYLLVALLTAVIVFVITKPLINVSEANLLTDAAVSGMLLAGLLFLLKNSVLYSHFSSLSFVQKATNYSALAILFVTCWVGLEYLILYLSFTGVTYNLFVPLVGVRIVIALLVYGLAILIYTQVSKSGEETIIGEDDSLAEEEADKEITDGEEKPEIIERIAVKNGQKIDVILVPEIIYLQAEGDYVMIHSTKGRFLKEQTMKSFESLLPSDKFVRVHRSNIVNVDFIAQVELYNKQTQQLKLKDGTLVKISLNGYKALKKTLGL